MLVEQETALLPFLKWAGGKRWFTTALEEHLPTNMDRYFEPFLGGGAIFFYLKPKKAILADLNDELVTTYAAIRDNWRLVQSYLEEYQQKHNKDFYYDERPRAYRGRYQRAAKFIYLNRVCWNGLYRVNLRGEFNVPLGTKTLVCQPTDDFASVSTCLQNSDLYTSDFESIIDKAKRNDFLFIDPPYVTAHNFNGFVKYNENIFSWADQVRLSAAVERAADRGAKILMTNADHPSIRALYRDIGSMQPISRASVISGSNASRQKVSELVVKTF